MATPIPFVGPGSTTVAPNFVSGGSSSLGVDILALADLDPRFILCSGYACLGQDLLHRLSTPNGTMINDPDYGYSVQNLLNIGFNQTQLNSFAPAIERECEKDERVQEASVTLAYSSGTFTLTITIAIETSAGPYVYILGVNNLTVALLAAPAS